MTRAHGPAVVAGVMILAMLALFMVTVGAMEDPSKRPDVARPGDRREKRLGSLSHGETVRIIRDLREARARATTPGDRAAQTLRLVDVYLGRKMHDRAVAYLKQARALTPGAPEVLARDALLLHLRGQRQQARRLIRELRARAPENSDVRRVAKVVE